MPYFLFVFISVIALLIFLLFYVCSHLKFLYVFEELTKKIMPLHPKSVSLKDIEEAQCRIKESVMQTPLVPLNIEDPKRKVSSVRIYCSAFLFANRFHSDFHTQAALKKN